MEQNLLGILNFRNALYVQDTCDTPVTQFMNICTASRKTQELLKEVRDKVVDLEKITVKNRGKNMIADAMF